MKKYKLSTVIDFNNRKLDIDIYGISEDAVYINLTQIVTEYFGHHEGTDSIFYVDSILFLFTQEEIEEFERQLNVNGEEIYE